MQTHPQIEKALSALPPRLTSRSGSVFYTAPSAFRRESPLYILGLNPGGGPTKQADATIARAVAEWREWPDGWSAYVHNRWEGAPPGEWGMQPRLRHMFEQLGRDLGDTPASNVVFVRSRNEATLTTEMPALLPICWPVHAAVIEALGVKTVLALGKTAGAWARKQLRAGREIGRFVEQNDRRWPSIAHAAPDGRTVVTVTHPGRVDWRNRDADPTPLVAEVLAR